MDDVEREREREREREMNEMNVAMEALGQLRQV